MKKTINIWVLAIVSLGLVACGEESNTTEKVNAAGEAKPTAAASEEPHAHGEGEHGHDSDSGHSHDAPKTETFYGDDAESAEGTAAPEHSDHHHEREHHDHEEGTHSDHHDQHQHEHEGGVDDHQH